MRARAARALSLALAVAVLGAPMLSGARLEQKPRGYRVVHAKRLAKGVTTYRLTTDDQRISIIRVAPGAKARPLVAVARNGIGPDKGAQRTSAMCRRHDCLAGVNGDFFYTFGRPAGAVVIDGEPVITRRYDRPHFVITRRGGYRIRKVSIPTSLRVRYPHAFEPVDDLTNGKRFDDEVTRTRVHGINSERGRNDLIVFTSRRGPTTGTGKKGVELVARLISHDRLRLDETVKVRIIERRPRGDSAIPRDGIVLSGRGDSARKLRTIWKDIRAGDAKRTVRLKVKGPSAAEQVLGGRPVLVRDGAVREHDSDWFARGTHARTLVGWTDDGTLLLVTVDDRGWAAGMNLIQAARLMKQLGARDALNLDGGGSTTFVRRGRVRNKPAYGSERRVGSALLIVR